MCFLALVMTSEDFVDYLLSAGGVIAENKDYVTELDAKTGDGDHWVNLNMGFEKIASIAHELKALRPADMLKKVGMTMMSSVGGSSGVLYGSAYMAAGKAVGDEVEINMATLHNILEAMQQAIMARGHVEPGFKTMLDSLHIAVRQMKDALDEGKSDADVMVALKDGARIGMEATRDMEAVKGRASYQTNKGVGNLDPGAVTMCMQLECLADTAMAKL
ncbi:MAG: dihydroxyacetone kinase subunit DhaL [Dethiobacteria bacterium]